MNKILLSLLVLSQCILCCYSQEFTITITPNQTERWTQQPAGLLPWTVASESWTVSFSASQSESQILSIQNLAWTGLPDGVPIDHMYIKLFYSSSLTGSQVTDDLVSLNNDWSAPAPPRSWNVIANISNHFTYTINNTYNWTTSVLNSSSFGMLYQVGIGDSDIAVVSLYNITIGAVFVAPPSPSSSPSPSISRTPSPSATPSGSSSPSPSASPVSLSPSASSSYIPSVSASASTTPIPSGTPSSSPSNSSTPSASLTPSPASSSSDHKSNNAAIIGGAVGGAAGLCLLGIVLSLLFIRKKKKRQEEEDHGAELQAQGLSPDPSIFDNSDIHLKDVKILHMLGKGKFGEVYEGLWSETTPVACKKLKQGERTEFENEIKLISKLNHPNIVRCLGIYVPDADTTYMVLELLKLGSLADFLRKPQSQWKLSVENLIELCLNTAAGMSYLESKNIVHRDLGARNLLVTETDSKYIVKVADFGLSRQVESEIYNATENVFPVRWSPPEVMNYRKFSTKSDVWSFAITCWEIFEWGKLPYPSMSNQECLEQVLAGYRLPQPKTCPDSIYKLMLECWKENPTARPDFKNIYSTIKNILADMKKDQKDNKKSVNSSLQSQSQGPDHYNTASNSNDILYNS